MDLPHALPGAHRWDDTGYTFNDPMAGKETHYLKKETEEAYEALGRQAVALVPMD